MPHSILLDGREGHVPTNRTLIITEPNNSDLLQSPGKQNKPIINHVKSRPYSFGPFHEWLMTTSKWNVYPESSEKFNQTSLDH